MAGQSKNKGRWEFCDLSYLFIYFHWGIYLPGYQSSDE